ncbi:MAG: hypothetical protein KAR79_03610 [Simkaniaceae bacterium]|nr:hypothetical protein [Simkaniaceae bacterium]
MIPAALTDDSILLNIFVDTLTGYETEKNLHDAHGTLRAVCKQWERVAKDHAVHALFFDTKSVLSLRRLQNLSTTSLYYQPPHFRRLSRQWEMLFEKAVHNGSWKSLLESAPKNVILSIQFQKYSFEKEDLEILAQKLLDLNSATFDGCTFNVGELSSFVSSCSKLETLAVKNFFNDDRFRAFCNSNFDRIKRLELGEGQYLSLSKVLPLIGSHFGNLTMLSLERILLQTDVDAKSLEGLNLRCIDLFNTHIIDDHMQIITTACSQIQSMRLDKCALLTDRSLDLMKDNCLELHSLSMSGNEGITNEGVNRFLTSGKELSHLELFGCSGIGDEAFLGFEMPTLLEVDLGSTRVVELSWLQSCIALEKLALLGSRLVLPDLLCEQLPHLRSLKKLDIRYMNGMNDVVLNSLGPNLTSFKAEKNSVFSNDALVNFGKKCRGLKELELRNSQGSISSGLQGMFSYLHGIKQINLLSTAAVDRDVSQAISKSCRNVERLVLTGCFQVRDDTLLLLHDLPALKTLEIGNTNVSKFGVEQLLRSNPNIQSIYLTIGKDQADDLSKKFPDVKIVNYTDIRSR